MPKVTKNAAPAAKTAAKPAAKAATDVGKGNVPTKPAQKGPKKPAPKPKKVEAAAAVVEHDEAEGGEQEVPPTGSMGRHDVAKALRDKVLATGAALPEKLADVVVKGFEEVVSEAVAKGQEVVLPGFGKFAVSFRPARTGRNPRTGEAADIPASFKVAFKPGKSLKDAANSREAVAAE